MRFTAEEIELAQVFKAYGLEWEPACGQYVLDQADVIGCPSPFQPGVFYILEMKHFLRRCGSLESMKQQMCWLPDWEQTRELLDRLGVPPQLISERLASEEAIARRTERLELYRMVEEAMTGVISYHP